MVDTPSKPDTPSNPGSIQPASTQKLATCRSILRQSLLQQRNALVDDALQVASANLLLHFKLWFASTNSTKQPLNVAGYLAVGGEINPAPAMSWLREHGHHTFLPVIRREQNGRLLFAPLTDSTDFVTGRYNIPEPVFRASELLDARILDLVLVPLVGFDSRGNRLGMGGGFYDRTFSFRLDNAAGHAHAFSQTMLGLAHQCQQVDAVSVESWDVPLDGVVTDQTIYTRG